MISKNLYKITWWDHENVNHAAHCIYKADNSNEAREMFRSVHYDIADEIRFVKAETIIIITKDSPAVKVHTNVYRKKAEYHGD